MKFRIAKECDLNEIVNIHYNVRESYPVGVFALLEKNFLRKYYRIILKDKYQIVVCAEDKDGKIIGFCSATLDVEKQFANILNHRFSLGIASICSIIVNPSLLKILISRYRFMANQTKDKITFKMGARGDFWAWNESKKDSISAIELHEIHLKILQNLGIKKLNFEVDTQNKKVYLFHKLNGAELVEKIILKDGRERAMMRYNLLNRKSGIYKW